MYDLQYSLQDGFTKGRFCLTNLVSFYDKVTQPLAEVKWAEVPKSVVQALCELCQSQCGDHFPEDSVPVPNQPLGEEPFQKSNINLP